MHTRFITKNGKKIPMRNKRYDMSTGSTKSQSKSMNIERARDLKREKITLKDFAKSGNYLEDEVRKRAKKGSPHFFDKETMSFFSSKVSELMWKDHNRNIWFITSEKDNGQHEHRGSARAFTVRKIDENGDIIKVGGFQEYSTLSEARTRIKNIIGLGA